MIKTIEIIINPASGVDTPILAQLNRDLQSSELDWNITVLKDTAEIETVIKNVVHKKVDAVIVCGGDGTVSPVARALYKTGIPLGIIPQGSANVIAKELSIPVSLAESIQLITQNKFKVKEIDVLLVNDVPLVIGINSGFFAHVVTNTERSVKEKVGSLAYGMATVAERDAMKEYDCVIKVDGKERSVRAAACYVVNIGNIGAASLSTGISVTDGILDVIAIQQINMQAFFEWMHSTITKSQPKNVVKHWKGKKITLKLPKSMTVLLDDEVTKERTFSIEVAPKTLKVIVPKS